jgi:dipicolinate synthase subunit A
VLKTKKIAFIGGDARMIFAAEEFARNGYSVSVYGLGNIKGFSEESAAAALSEADFAVLPPAVSRDGENVYSPLSEKKIPLRGLDFGDAEVFCGSSCPWIAQKMRNYAEQEAFAIGNAVPTAEGALKIAMEATGRTLCGLRTCLLGYGRIGKILAKDLAALGASVDVFARRGEARALAEAFGFSAYDFGALEEKICSYECIFNTVPQNVLPPRTLARIGESVPVIELASPPGGVDAEEAEKACVRIVPAGGLPGKIMPKTAGKIIYETISEMIREEENT